MLWNKTPTHKMSYISQLVFFSFNVLLSTTCRCAVRFIDRHFQAADDYGFFQLLQCRIFYCDHLTGECVCVCALLKMIYCLCVGAIIYCLYIFCCCWTIANITICSVYKSVYIPIFFVLFCFFIFGIHSIWNWNPFNRSRSAVLHT